MDSAPALRCFLIAALVAVFQVAVRGGEPAPKIALVARHTAGELSLVEAAMEVGGDVKLVTEGAEKQLPMNVVANLKYDEQVAAVDQAGRPRRSLRWYHDTRATIKIDKGGEKPSLDPERRLIAVDEVAKGAPLLYSPNGPLKREELDLIDIPGNTLLVDQLLPAESIAAGEKWKLADDTLARLLGLDAVSWSDVESMISGANADLVEVLSGGSVSGAIGGVSTEIELKVKYRFDRKLGRVNYLAMLIKEKRAIGHVNPGLDTVAKVIIKITPLATSEHLSEKVVDGTRPAAPDAAELVFVPLGRQFAFRYDRRWFVTSDAPKLAVLRLIDRGELVAQCNISALPTATKTVPTLAGFQQDVQQSLGKNFGQFLSAAEQKSDAGYAVYRLVARGTVSDLPVQWIYYLIIDLSGHRVSLAFTFEQQLEERFGQADRALVAQLRLTTPPAPTTARVPNKLPGK